MTISVDATSNNIGVYGTSHSHAGGSPTGVVVLIMGANAAVSAVTYGGTSMTQMTGSPATAPGTGELAGSFQSAWILTTGAASGTQSVVLTGPTSASIAVTSYDTASEDIEEVDTAQISSNSVVDPSTTVSLGGNTCHVWQVYATGRDTTAGYSALTGWTLGSQADIGATCIGIASYDTIGSSDVTAGLDFGAEEDDILLFAVAIKEADVAADVTGSGALTLPSVTASGSGLAVTMVTGTGALIVPSLTGSGTGTAAGDDVEGTGAFTVPLVTVSGSGNVEAATVDVFVTGGAASITMPSIVLSGSGLSADNIAGSGALSVPSITVQGTGLAVTTITSTGALNVPVATVSGSGEVLSPNAASGSPTLPAVTVQGAGLAVTTVTGTGSLVLPVVTMSGRNTQGTPTPSPGAPLFPPKASDPRVVQFLSDMGVSATGGVDYDFRLALGFALGFTASQSLGYSVQDMWKRYLDENNVIDIKEPFTFPPE